MGLLICAAIIAILTLGDYDLARRLHRANSLNARLARRLVVLEVERVDAGLATDDVTELVEALRREQGYRVETTPLHDAVFCEQFESQFEEES